MAVSASATSALGSDAAVDDGADRGWSIAPAKHDDTRERIRSRPREEQVLHFADASPHDATLRVKRNHTGTSDDADGDSSSNRIVAAAVVAVAAAVAAVVPARWSASRTSQRSVHRAAPEMINSTARIKCNLLRL